MLGCPARAALESTSPSPGSGSGGGGTLVPHTAVIDAQHVSRWQLAQRAGGGGGGRHAAMKP